jgi:hypothetical protein
MARRATAKWLTIIGLVLTLFGAGCGTYGVWLSPDEAIERGVSRWSGGTRDQQLQLPPVQNPSSAVKLCRSWLLADRGRYSLSNFRSSFCGTLPKTRVIVG